MPRVANAPILAPIKGTQMNDDIRNAHSSAAKPDGKTTDGDHDQPYEFGRRPSSRAPFPFTTREFARLLVLRSRLDTAAA
jgi:hypothetical protein